MHKSTKQHKKKLNEKVKNVVGFFMNYFGLFAILLNGLHIARIIEDLFDEENTDLGY